MPPPKTPRPIPQREFAESAREFQSDFPIISSNGNGVWKAIATGLGGLVVGLIVAWFTAIQNKGVTQSTLEDYVDKHSPYLMDKGGLSEHNQNQDRQIGILEGKQERAFDRLGALESKLGNDEREITDLRGDLRTKTEMIANLLEEQRKAKK